MDLAENDVIQLVFPGFKFGLDDPGAAAALVELGVGGFCLYGGNAGEVADFTVEMQKIAKIPLLFNADHEDGVASQSPGGTRLPSNMGIGAAGSEDLAFQKGAITAAEARAMGVHWVLAPVVDLATQPLNPIVNIRSFSADPAEVIRLAKAYIKGLQSRKVLCCIKHFPGHGETLKDSHLELPQLNVTREVLLKRELAPFRELGEIADSVMTGHLSVSALEEDVKIPVSLSQKSVLGTLRSKLNFKGLISTDALSMHAISRHFSEEKAAVMALVAGSDVLLVPVDPRKMIYALLDRLQEDPALRALVAQASARLRKAKEFAGLFQAGGLALTGNRALIGCPEHRAAAQKMAEACLAWATKPLQKSLSAVYYMEPDNEKPEDWEGTALVSHLRECGLRVESEMKDTDTLLVGCFLRPHAYTGRIRYEPEFLERVQRAMAGAKRTVMVSCGSPFLLEDFKGYEAALCAFAGDADAQRAAARVLAGKATVSGRMPVSLKL